MNMMLAVLLASGNDSDDCEWYFTNLSIDVIFGVLLCWLMLKSVERFAAFYQIDVLNTGVYIHNDYSNMENANLDPTKQATVNTIIDYRIWAIQIIVWGMIVMTSKIVLYFFQLSVAENLEQLTAYIFLVIKPYPKIKLIIIMVIVPVCLNSF